VLKEKCDSIMVIELELEEVDSSQIIFYYTILEFDERDPL